MEKEKIQKDWKSATNLASYAGIAASFAVVAGAAIFGPSILAAPDDYVKHLTKEGYTQIQGGQINTRACGRHGGGFGREYSAQDKQGQSVKKTVCLGAFGKYTVNSL